MGSPVRMYWSALTSYSSNSRSAPAALRTLIASGTTSFPAPSQGRTAMWLRRSRFLVAQLVALDLAGHGLRQLVDELDHVRILEPLQARLAVLLQLDDERVGFRRVLLGDHERLDLREAVELHADHRTLRDGRMLEQRRLDLDRRDPQPADFDHVVRATFVPVEAVFVLAVAVAAEEPLADDAPLRLFVLRPVEGKRAVAFHVEVAGLALPHWFAFIVEDLQLIARYGLATRTRLQVVQPVRAVDVQHLGGPDAVEDREPKRV